MKGSGCAVAWNRWSGAVCRWSTSIPARPTVASSWRVPRGAEVVELDMSRPFTMARGRNAGFARLEEIDPDVRFVQFVDGDCEVVTGWLDRACTALGEPLGCRDCRRSASRAVS